MRKLTLLKNTAKLLTNPEDAKNAFMDYHLVRRKYILSHACNHFGLNSLEPAPLLNYSLLDMGCGKSKLAHEMTFRGADVTALDSREDAITHAKEAAEQDGAIVDFLQGGADDLIQQNKKFDIILCMDLFEYVDHTSKFIEQMDSLLKDDGILIFSTNNRNLSSFIWHILFAEYIFKWIPKNSYRFKRFRPPERLTDKLLDKNYVMVDLCGVYLDPQEKRWKRKERVGARYLGAAIRKQAAEKKDAH